MCRLQKCTVSNALNMLAAASCGNATCIWLDAEGASLIGTLHKTVGDEQPLILGRLLINLVQRACNDRVTDPAAANTAALGVAHLLPGLVRYGLLPPASYEF